MSKILPAVLIGVAWMLATALAHGLGLSLHCDAGRTWQLLDLPELRDNLAQSLWYQHGQPPGFNLLVGLFLKAGAEVDGLALHVFFDLLGLLAGLLTGQVALQLGARPMLAAAAGALLVITPGFALYQHWMLYDLPVTVAILACALAVLAAVQHPTWLRMAVLVVTCAGLMWMRSVFHLVWMAGMALAVLVPRDAQLLPRRRIAQAMVLALLLGALPFAKNASLFGRFEASTWAGMSAERLTHQFIPLVQRQRMAALGQIDPVSVVGPYQPLDAYPTQMVDWSLWRGIAVLEHPTKRDGHPNFNHVAYLPISQTMLRDAVTLVRAHPQAYAQAHLSAWLHWLRPASVHPNLAQGRQLLRPWLEPWNRLALVEVAQVHLLLVFGALLAMVLLLAMARTRTAVAAGLPPPARAMLRALAWTALWITLLGNTLEHGENYRFRAYLDPVFLAVLAAAVSQLLAPRPVMPRTPLKQR